MVLEPGVDPASVGAMVTSGLCGHWEHDGACRWPHNNEIDTEADPPVFLTLFIAPSSQEAEVRARIEEALRASTDWRVLSCTGRGVAAGEQGLAERLIAYDGAGAR